MLTASLSGPTEIVLWHGVADRARERNTNLICFSGGIPYWMQQYEHQKNILFNIAGHQNVNGLLIWANILSHTLDHDSLNAFCLRYAPLPMISMGMIFPSIPSIRIDMRDGICQLLSHLINEHGRRKIAFIRGLEVSQDAEDRYQAYCETLDQYGLPVNPDLVYLGDFRRYSGRAAIQQLVDTRRASFDALVSANDNMAIGAMQALQERGFHIPDDVAIAGFDDIEETRAVLPSLTTVRAPWYMLGSKSIDLMLSKMAEEPIPESILLQTELVYRRSCGCQPATSMELPRISIHSSNQPTGITYPSQFVPSINQTDIRLSIAQLISSIITDIPRMDPDWAEKLINNFIVDVNSEDSHPGAFTQTLLGILSRISSGTHIIEWQKVLDGIRLKVNLLFQHEREIIKAHELLEIGYSIIAEMAHRSQLSQRLEEENQTDRLNRIVQTISTIHDIETLMKLLVLELPGLGIHSCFLSLYDEKGDHPAWSRLILAYIGKERLYIDPVGIRFPTTQLVPAGMLPKNQVLAYDVEALYYQEDQIGFVLFEIGPREGDVYTTLRGHLSTALKSAELVQVALDAEAKAKKADQLKTNLLANVSHELRTPINIILGLSQTALSSPNPYGIELPDQLIRDLEYIYESGEHLVRLINDLLDMSRAEIGELDLRFEPVTPRALLKEAYDTFKESYSNKQKDINFLLDIPEHLPLLYADPVRLRQILLNLLSNAFKFTKRGKIILGAEVQLPHLHMWVSDTGTGISPELQEHIFEPFVKSEHPGQHRGGVGLGLSITRRLVALHGGSVVLDSQPGQGSTFHVYIPLPGLNAASAKEASPEGARSILLWISSDKTPATTILNLCQKRGIEPRWLNSVDDLDPLLARDQPVALAWDLDNARPGDWAIIQRLRGFPVYCQLPLLLFQESSTGKLAEGGRLTNVILKPVGKLTFQHILDLIPQALQHGEIWIIDDDSQALAYYQDMIRKAQSEFTVRSIQGGKEALQLLSETTPDLVLLDLMMPEVDGFQVLQHLRSNTKTAMIPVVILTGKMLSYEDVRRLDFPRVSLHIKGVLSAAETFADIQHALTATDTLPQPTSVLAKQALAYIQRNYSRAFSLKELSATIGVSKSYLSRIFKMETGISLWDYLNRYRIQKAQELLLLTSDSITEIAAKVGFEDVGYFGRVFRGVTGCSPRAYKQKALASRPPEPIGQ